MVLTPFSHLTAALQAAQAQECFHITLPADWLQGRTTYGGLSAALSLAAVQRSHADLPPLRSAQLTFVGPASGQLELAPSLLRRGKSTVLLACDMQGDSGLAVRSTFCFGTGRASAHDHPAPALPPLPGPEACPDYYAWPGLANFMHHFEGRLAGGARPGTPGAAPAMSVWLRHRDAGDESSLVRLLALADALPPAALVMSSGPTPISTMTWSIEMLEVRPFSSTGWWLVQAEAETSREGYSVQNTVIWSADGQPVLLARQCLTIFG